MEEEEKQGENGKKEEEKGRDGEGERDVEKTDSEMGEATSRTQQKQHVDLPLDLAFLASTVHSFFHTNNQGKCVCVCSR